MAATERAFRICDHVRWIRPGYSSIQDSQIRRMAGQALSRHRGMGALPLRRRARVVSLSRVRPSCCDFVYRVELRLPAMSPACLPIATGTTPRASPTHGARHPREARRNRHPSRCLIDEFACRDQLFPTRRSVFWSSRWQESEPNQDLFRCVSHRCPFRFLVL